MASKYLRRFLGNFHSPFDTKDYGIAMGTLQGFLTGGTLKVFNNVMVVDDGTEIHISLRGKTVGQVVDELNAIDGVKFNINSLYGDVPAEAIVDFEWQNTSLEPDPEILFEPYDINLDLSEGWDPQFPNLYMSETSVYDEPFDINADTSQGWAPAP